MKFIKQNLVETDIFLERYLPCKILNMIKDVNDEVISDYNDRKKYLTQLDAEFKKVMQKNCHISFKEFENFETEEYNKINEKSKEGELKDLESFQ